MNLTTFLATLNSGEKVLAGSEVHKYMHKLSQEVSPTVTVFPPVFTDCGKNLHFAENIFINSGCKFQDQGGIHIGSGTLVGHNVVFASLNHEQDPQARGNLLPGKITNQIGQVTTRLTTRLDRHLPSTCTVGICLNYSTIDIPVA